MAKLRFYLVYGFSWLLHLLPDFLLYALSDFLAFVLYNLVRYRRGVVFSNLRRAFPEWSERDYHRTARKFYRHLCDSFLETTVYPFLSKESLFKRMSYKNPELLSNIHEQGRSVMAVLGHYGNWEFLSTLILATGYPIIGIYKPLKNKAMDDFIRKSRGRHGSILVAMEKVARKLIELKREGTPSSTIFLSDQRPVLSQSKYWTSFMGQKTAMFTGVEKLALKLDAPVVFLNVRKLQRGRYEMEIELLTDKPSELKDHEITDLHVAALERLIREEPAYWLWSHQRWKHSYESYLERYPQS